MKRLDFTSANPDAKDFFSIIYDAILTTPRGYLAPGETRQIGKLMDKMEAIGIACKRASDFASFDLHDGGVIEIEEEIYKLAYEALHAVRWNGIGARKATRAVDWFDAAPAAMNEVGIDKETKK